MRVEKVTIFLGDYCEGCKYLELIATEKKFEECVWERAYTCKYSGMCHELAGRVILGEHDKKRIGYWLPRTELDDSLVRCSECNSEVWLHVNVNGENAYSSTRYAKYCPVCGAEMHAEGEET